MFGKRRLDWLCLLGIFCLLLNTDITTQAQTQNKRSSRITSSRSFGTNVKQTSSNGVNFDCPEEFGYYPHPTDCTQYYVCVFGGALLESCTGGLMYSHELQTCDWPRNVGCEVVDNGAAASAANSRDSNSGRGNKHQQQSQHVPSRVRFGSAFTSAAASTPQPQKPTVPPQYHRQPPQTIQAQVQNIPPPPELKVPPNPVITSRGQPKPLLDSQEDIAKLYADALDALPSVEEEDSERQQRVYRGQPSTVSQVQRDRDGIIHQASINAIPNHGKIGSYAFGSQFRDIEYQQQHQQQQHNRQQQQQQQQQQDPQQYQSQQPIRQQQTTYRPLEILTTPTPQQVPIRETYINKPLSSQKTQNYNNQQSLIYNTDYEEDLIAQIEQDNVYDQPTRSPSRNEHVTIQTLNERPTSTARPFTANDERNYYSTLTTELPSYTSPTSQTYAYETSDEYGEVPDYYASITERAFYQQPTRYTTFAPKLVATQESDEYNIIGSELSKEVTKSNDATYNNVDSTLNFIPATVTTPIAGQQNIYFVSSTTPTTSKKLTSTSTTTTTKTTATPTKTSTVKSTTQIIKTTTPTTTTKAVIRINANSNNSRNRGSAHYANQDRDIAAPVTSNRGTHPPRTRPTLKPSGTIVSKAQEFIDIYKNPPTRPDPLYPQPTPDKTAAKCRKDVCLLPDCSCGGKEIPGDLSLKETPQVVLITFDDAVSQLNIELYEELFNNSSRKNPNGCPLRATFYVSHEWTDYGMVQDLYADGHEMASHTVSHSFGEQFSQKKWTREVAGQREILSAYGGVKLSDVRGMRAPFLSVGGNKMYKMLYDSNFTYDSSMPVYENRPPSWPYTLDYKIFHDCMIPPCPTKSYPGVWQVPMVMWQDLNGGRCSMGDACSNPSEADGVYKMIMKNFERHYTTNRAPFGLFYHAAWFTQPHHKEGFIKFLDAINAMPDVWIITNWQMLQWVRDPTPNSRINSFQPFQCDYSDRPKRCNNPKVCNLWHKSGVRYMKTCQPCPDIYPWTGKTGIRSSRIDNDIEDSTA